MCHYDEQSSYEVCCTSSHMLLAWDEREPSWTWTAQMLVSLGSQASLQHHTSTRKPRSVLRVRTRRRTEC